MVLPCNHRICGMDTYWRRAQSQTFVIRLMQIQSAMVMSNVCCESRCTGDESCLVSEFVIQVAFKSCECHGKV